METWRHPKDGKGFCRVTAEKLREKSDAGKQIMRHQSPSLGPYKLGGAERVGS